MHLICRRYNNILHFSKAKRITTKYQNLHESIIRLNVQKTYFVVFAPKNTNNNITSITLRNQQILRVNNAKCLGIYIVDGLKWDDHISHIVKTVSSGSYAIHTVQKYLSFNNLKSVCYSLSHSHLTYGTMLWGSTFHYILDKLEIS